MITIPQPSMALNAQGVPGPYYRMWNSWTVPPSTAASHVLGWTASVGAAAKAKYPDNEFNVVINCHGAPARMALGSGIGWAQVPLFSLWAPMVDNIYIVACEVVSFTGAGDGNLFCGAIAKQAACNVFASNHTQTTGAWPYIPYGKIDGFEGNVWMWDSSGANTLTSL